MSFLLPVLLCLLLFAVVALLFNAGMWNNAITLINLVTAALLAMNYFEPTTRWLDSQIASLTYLWDFVALWGLFIAFMVVFRMVTGMISKVKVRFLDIADRIGSLVFAVLIGGVLIAFTLATLHTAPLGRNFLFDGFRPNEPMFFGMSPDLRWLEFTKKQSAGSFSRGVEGEERARYGGTSEVAVFDAGGKFIANYTVRRTALEKNMAAGKGICPDAERMPPR